MTNATTKEIEAQMDSDYLATESDDEKSARQFSEDGTPLFENWTDRELAVYTAQTIYVASQAIQGVQAEVTPMMERFKKGGILAMMKGF